MLEIKPLKNCVSCLEEGLAEYQTNPSEFVKESCIHRFELTYRLSFRMVKRCLKELSENSGDIDRLGFKPLIREAVAKGLMSDFDKWVLYRDRMSKAGYIYNEELLIEEVLSVIPDFLEEARFVVKQLSELLEREALCLSAT